MGLLNSNSLNEWAMAIPDRAREIYQGLLGAPAEIKQLFDPKFQKGLLDQRSVTDKFDKQKALATALEATGMAPMGIAGHIVYHGSPHKFDKFDMSKIGTGEGAQAYGHGLYFAESPSVARGYAEKLNPTKVAAQSNTEAMGTAARVMEAVDGNAERAIAELTARKNMPHVKGNAEWAEKMDAAIAHIKGGMPTSQFYKVDIPDEAIPRMLDWDKPLSEQGPQIQDIAKQWNNGKLPRASMSGDELLRYIEQQNRFIGSGKKAEDVLREAGIPGIRYLDGMSRGAGQGSSNYVLFDDQLARILEVNGQPTGLLPWNK